LYEQKEKIPQKKKYLKKKKILRPDDRELYQTAINVRNIQSGPGGFEPTKINACKLNLNKYFLYKFFVVLKKGLI
jgi:hypothetical protein